ncbi:MAG: hypothetical protein KDD66_13780 [Bdellovibrionales bacterium]|nr:hypothetical protein [Bdellovibrionales bacterium]
MKTILRIIVFSLFLLVFCSPLLADELPPRKAGLWSLSTEVEGMPGASHTLQQCIDAATDKELMNLSRDIAAKTGAKCAKNAIDKVSGKYVHEADCMMAGSHIVSRTTFAGDFNSSYVATSITTYTPPMMGMSDTHSTVTAKYLGPCAAGMDPGDVMLPDGKKMTLKAMRAMQGGL